MNIGPSAGISMDHWPYCETRKSKISKFCFVLATSAPCAIESDQATSYNLLTGLGCVRAKIAFYGFTRDYILSSADSKTLQEICVNPLCPNVGCHIFHIWNIIRDKKVQRFEPSRSEKAVSHDAMIVWFWFFTSLWIKRTLISSTFVFFFLCFRNDT